MISGKCALSWTDSVVLVNNVLSHTSKSTVSRLNSTPNHTPLFCNLLKGRFQGMRLLTVLMNGSGSSFEVLVLKASCVCKVKNAPSSWHTAPGFSSPATYTEAWKESQMQSKSQLPEPSSHELSQQRFHMYSERHTSGPPLLFIYLFLRVFNNNLRIKKSSGHIFLNFPSASYSDLCTHLPS